MNTADVKNQENTRLLMNEATVIKTIASLAQKIATAYPNELKNGKLIFVGIETRGLPVAKKAAEIIKKLAGIVVPVAPLNIKIYSNNLGFVNENGQATVQTLKEPTMLRDKTVILWDDVIWRGRTIQTALPIIQQCQPAKVTCAILVDRVGYHDSDLTPEFVGLRQKTKNDEIVKVCMKEVEGDNETSVRLVKKVKKGEKT